MYNYVTVTEAIIALEDRGYSRDFNIHSETECFICNRSQTSLSADDFEIDEVYRFEGNTDPGDEMIVYAISSKKFDIKGTLVSAYGMYEKQHNLRGCKNLIHHQ